MRLLGSVRVEGETVPDLSQGWRTERVGDFLVDVPAAWEKGSSAYRVFLRPRTMSSTVPGYAERGGSAGWTGSVSPDERRNLAVTAPTHQALTDLILDSARVRS